MNCPWLLVLFTYAFRCNWICGGTDGGSGGTATNVNEFVEVALDIVMLGINWNQISNHTNSITLIHILVPIVSSYNYIAYSSLAWCIVRVAVVREFPGKTPIGDLRGLSVPFSILIRETSHFQKHFHRADKNLYVLYFLVVQLVIVVLNCSLVVLEL